MTIKYSECPICTSSNLIERWGNDRKRQQVCKNCDWIGELRTPEQIEIKTTREIYSNKFPHQYELYDRFGYMILESKSYKDENECEQELLKSLEKHNKKYGPCTGLIWPIKAIIKAKVYK